MSVPQPLKTNFDANKLEDVIYKVDRGLAWITINRPQVYNSFRCQTIDELILCFKQAWADNSVGVVCLTGAGDKAFCCGGDQKQRLKTGDYGPSQSGLFEVEFLHRLIRNIPKPVIAAVNGYAIGGGHVLHVICDLTLASQNAVFGQTGPKVGSFDAGFGSAYLARIIGEKKAREIWYLCRQYSAKEAESMGLVNKVLLNNDLLKKEVRIWADEILNKSPVAIAVLKHSFNADSEQIAGIQKMAFDTLHVFEHMDESKEGIQAFNEKRKPNFQQFRGKGKSKL